MTKGEAIARIQEDLGFTTGQSAVIGKRLVECQDELEFGKSLPWLLLVENGTIGLNAGASTAVLPEGFIRPEEMSNLRFRDTTTDVSHFVPWVQNYDSALLVFARGPGEVGMPQAAYLWKSTIDFFGPADRNYTFTLSYYKKEPPLTVDGDTNAWLSNSAMSLWLMGEAGFSMAMSRRDKDAIAIFDKMRTKGRSATFGEELWRDGSQGAYYLGSGL